MALTVSQLASITQELYIPKAVDAIFLSNGTLFRLREKGIKYSGGRDIVQPVIYAKVTASNYFEGYEVLATTPNDVLTAAVFQYRQYYAHISISGREELLNSGKEAILNLLEAKRMAAEMTLMDNLGSGLQGTNATVGKAIDGLQDMLSTSNTYGGIATTDFSNWAAKQRTLTTAGTLTLADMQRAFGSATIGSDHPTVVITRQSVFDKFWTLLQPDQRFVDKNMGEAGFTSLSFNGVPLIVDSHVPGSDGGSQNNWVEFLNERYVWLGIHKDANFKVVPIPPTREQDVKMVRILWAGNLLTSRRDVHCFINSVDPNL